MLKVLIYALSGMFVVGAIGCLIVIPITALRLFTILFEHDPPDEKN